MRAIAVIILGLSVGCSGDAKPHATALHLKRRGESVSPVRGSMNPRAPLTPPTLPLARRVDVVDAYHGVRVEDPYRWMETPSPELDAWLKAQDDHTRDLLGAVPGRARLRDELHEANRATDRIDVIKVVGERPRVFAMHQTSTDESPKLVTLDGWNSAERVLVDPNGRAGGGSHVTVDSAYPSPDGTYVAYVVATAGSEDGTVEIVDVRSGRILSDRIDRVQER